jgi:hypothetical protein
MHVRADWIAELLPDMDALQREPDFPVTTMFLRTMFYLLLRAGDAPDLLQKQQGENMESTRIALLAALPLKRGKALALSRVRRWWMTAAYS